MVDLSDSTECARAKQAIREGWVRASSTWLCNFDDGFYKKTGCAYLPTKYTRQRTKLGHIRIVYTEEWWVPPHVREIAKVASDLALVYAEEEANQDLSYSAICDYRLQLFLDLFDDDAKFAMAVMALEARQNRENGSKR